MNKKIYLSICALYLNTAVILANDNLGKIQIESSTIEDLTTNLKTESSTINVINEQTINEIDPKNINDLLQTIPGVTADVRSDVVEIHIRGVNQQEFMWEDTGVAVIIDGVPVQQVGGKVRGINIDEIESIKVIKGSAGYLYGEQASSGAIIITTKKAKDKNSASISAETGSFDYKNYKAKLYKSTKNYSINLMGGYKKEDGYWYQTSNDQKTYSGKVTYYIDDMSDVAFSADYIDRYQETTRGSVRGVTEADSNPTGKYDGDWAWSRNYNSDIYKYLITYNKDFINSANLKINTYYYKDLYDYISSPKDLNDDGIDDAYVKDSNDDIKQYGIKAEYRNQNQNIVYMIGTDLGKKKYDEYDGTIVNYSSYNYRTHKNEDYYAGESTLEETTENKYAIYGETKYNINKRFIITLNLRYDHNKYDSTTYKYDYDGVNWSNNIEDDDSSYNNLTYRLGTTYNLNKNKTIFANISTGFRNPSVSQDDENQNIDTQTYITYETGLRGITPFGAKCEASIFITDTKDIISKVYGTYNWDSRYYDNVGDSRNKGLEVSLQQKTSDKLSYSISYTYLDAYYTSHKPFIVALNNDDITYDITNNQLPRVPHHKLDIITIYKPNNKLKLFGEIYAQSKYYADETNLMKVAGYAKINLKASYYYNKHLELFTKVDNLLDKQYYRTVYLFSDKNKDNKLDQEDASITVDPGRVWYAGVKYLF